VQGQDNLSQSSVAREDAGEAAEDDYQRIAILAKSLKREELLGWTPTPSCAACSGKKT
jgi:molecular chaperone Hsp33